MATLDDFARLYAERSLACVDSGTDKSGGGAFEAALAKARKVLCGPQSRKHVPRLVLAPLAELHALGGELAVEQIRARLARLGVGMGDKAGPQSDAKAPLTSPGLFTSNLVTNLTSNLISNYIQ